MMVTEICLNSYLEWDSFVGSIRLMKSLFSQFSSRCTEVGETPEISIGIKSTEI